MAIPFALPDPVVGMNDKERIMLVLVAIVLLVAAAGFAVVIVN